MEIRTKKEWSGKYRDINWEINNFTILDKPAWTYYLYIKLDQIPENVRERFWLEGKPSGFSKHIMYDYYDEPLISDLDWQGGCTWYRKFGHDGNPRVVQIGCDYQHIWNEGRYYNMEMILEDVIATIDSLYVLIPDIMKWCSYCGDYYNGDTKYCQKCMDEGR